MEELDVESELGDDQALELAVTERSFDDMVFSESGDDTADDEDDGDGRRLQYGRRQGLRGRRGRGRRGYGRPRRGRRRRYRPNRGPGGGKKVTRDGGIIGSCHNPWGPCDNGPGNTGPGNTGPGNTGPGNTGPGNTGPGNTGGQLNYCSGGIWCTIFSGPCVVYKWDTAYDPQKNYCPSGTFCYDPNHSRKCIVW